jgi:hypothetical protein
MLSRISSTRKCCRLQTAKSALASASSVDNTDRKTSRKYYITSSLPSLPSSSRSSRSSSNKRYFSDNFLGYNPMSQHKSISKNPKKSKPTKPSSSEKPYSPGIGVDSNTEGGGVWANTSAKKDKLGELKLEIKFDNGEKSLDDKATLQEKMDLDLLDGVSSIVKMIDCGGVVASGDDSDVDVDDSDGVVVNGIDFNTNDEGIWNDIQILMKEFVEEISMSITNTNRNVHNGTHKIFITEEQYNKHLNDLFDHVELMRLQHPARPRDDNEQEQENELSSPTAATMDGITAPNAQPSSLLYIRDFLFYDPPNPNEKIPSKLSKEMIQPITKPFEECYEYFQILLLQSALMNLISDDGSTGKSSKSGIGGIGGIGSMLSNATGSREDTWFEKLTKISSADVDRAATKGEIVQNKKIHSMDVLKLHSVIASFANGSCSDRVKSLWDLMDKDDDGLLDQEEMDRVVYMSIKPMEDAFKSFIEDSTDVWPVRKWGLPPPCLEGGDGSGGNGGSDVNGNDDVSKAKKLGFYKKWKLERYERKSKRTLLKLLDGTIKRHFDIEVETPHRLRCVYAWAEKEHQDGKTESVLVDASSNDESATGGGFLSGTRKRYVELDPKISYDEFREIQEEHFSHLDRVGQELCTSLKEDLWVHQGKGRQNQELKREIGAFLFVVSLIDYAIITH